MTLRQPLLLVSSIKTSIPTFQPTEQSLNVMKNSSQLAVKRQLALLLVGSPGSGKTTLALQFPKPYVFDCDGNLQGPEAFLKREKRSQPFFWDSAFTDDDGKPIPPFQRYGHFEKCMLRAANDPNIETIILDSLTGFADIVKDDILRQRSMNPSVGKAAAHVTEATRGMTPLMMPEWDTFGFYFRNIVTQMRTLPNKNFILTAHMEQVQNEADKVFYECLALQGNSRYKLSGFFTDTWQTFVAASGWGDSAKVERKIRTIASSVTDMKGNKASLDLPQVFSNEGDAAMKLVLPQLV